ncbi:MAG: hypothetical protein PVF68_03595 [Acidobacteriota bacterium]|jgi:hypothetical protein
MSSRIADTIHAQGEEAFIRRMEGLSASERREIFHELDVPPAGPSASARRRNLRRIQAAWQRLQAAEDPDAAETFARHWLARSAMPMIVEFLDRMEISHQGGYLQDEAALEGLDPEVAAAALRDLEARHDPEDVRLYAALMDLPGS